MALLSSPKNKQTKWKSIPHTCVFIRTVRLGLPLRCFVLINTFKRWHLQTCAACHPQRSLLSLFSCFWGSFEQLQQLFPHTEAHKQPRHRASHPRGAEPSRACWYLLRTALIQLHEHLFFSSSTTTELREAAAAAAVVMAAAVGV